MQYLAVGDKSSCHERNSTWRFFNLALLLQLDTESYFHCASAVLLARHRQICAANASQQEKYSTSVINGLRFKVALTSVPLLC